MDNPDSGLAQLERGQVLAMGQLGEVAAAFERALVLDPVDAISALNLGSLALVRGDTWTAEAAAVRRLLGRQ